MRLNKVPEHKLAGETILIRIDNWIITSTQAYGHYINHLCRKNRYGEDPFLRAVGEGGFCGACGKTAPDRVICTFKLIAQR